ncbi:hypothetical protein VB779_09305 [Haloarculaceae archaeon H-GB11]|nr:hypothetical protein [Haloarculaceae archaeon H-GB11]
MVAIEQGSTGLDGLGEGITVSGVLYVSLVLVVLILLQWKTERNIFNFLARLDGIGLISIGTALMLVTTLRGVDFQSLRSWGAIVAGVIVLLVAWQSSYVDELPEYLAWFTIDGSLRLVLVSAMVVSSVLLVTGTETSVMNNVYFMAFPVGGGLLLTAALVPAKKLAGALRD